MIRVCRPEYYEDQYNGKMSAALKTMLLLLLAIAVSARGASAASVCTSEVTQGSGRNVVLANGTADVGLANMPAPGGLPASTCDVWSLSTRAAVHSGACPTVG